MFEHRSSKSELGLQCSIFWVKHGISKSELGLQCSMSPPRPPAPPPSPATHCLFFSFFLFFLFFSTPNFEARLQSSKVPTSNFEVGTLKSGSKFELRSWNFEPRLQCSMFSSPHPRQPPTIFSFFSFFSFLFFSTTNFEASFDVQCYPPPSSPLRASHPFFFSFFTPNFEPRLFCTMFSPCASHPLFFFSFFLFLSFVFFHAKLRSQTLKFNVLPSPPPPATATHYLFFDFFHFLCFFPRQTSKPDFKSSNFELRSWNFEPILQCSMFPTPSLAPATHYLFFRFFFYFFLLCFPRQTSKPDFDVQCSFFPLPPRQPPTFFFFVFFFFFLFFVPRKTSKPDFNVPTSNFEVGTSKPDFNVPTSNFEVGPLKSGSKFKNWNLENLWELLGRAHPRGLRAIERRGASLSPPISPLF